MSPMLQAVSAECDQRGDLKLRGPGWAAALYKLGPLYEDLDTELAQLP